MCCLVNRGDVITSIAKSLKNPRSAVCKTALMTCADIFSVYNDLIIDSLDPLVSQHYLFVLVNLLTHIVESNHKLDSIISKLMCSMWNKYGGCS